MKRRVSLLLVFILIFTSMNFSYAANVEPTKAEIINTVSSGLNYYVVFQFNGHAYRSDQVPQSINNALWENLNNDDKMKVAKVYGFSPNARIDQFDIDGSITL